MIQERDAREWRDRPDKVKRFPSPLVVFALRAFRVCLARHADSQGSNGIFDGFRDLSPDISLIGQIDDVVF